jgi:hypothetical protein
MMSYGNGVISLGYWSTPNIYFCKMIYQGIVIASRTELAYAKAIVEYAGAIAGSAGHITSAGSSQVTRPSLTSSAQRATAPSSSSIETPKPQSTGGAELNTAHATQRATTPISRGAAAP